MAKEKGRVWPRLAAALLCAFTAACSGGGGGGGGSASGDPVPAAYTGVRTQAVIDQNNAQVLALDAYSAGESGLLTLMPGAVQGAGTVQPQMVPSTCPGSGGFMEDSVEFTASGDFSGPVHFRNYCEEGTTLNGSMQVSGKLNGATGAWQATFTTDGLAFSAEGEAFTVSGSLSVADDPSASTVVFKPRLVLAEGGRQTYMDYTVTLRTLSNGDEMSMSGRHYASEYGYVDFTTEDTVKISLADGLPAGGRIRFTGANGSSATLTFKPGGVYTISPSGGNDIEGRF